MNKSMKPDTVWTLAIGGAVLLFLISILAFVMPKPTVQSEDRKQKSEVRKLQGEARTAEAKAATLVAGNQPLLWSADAETIGAKSLNNVSKLAKAKKLKLINFRTQRPVDGEALQRLPFLVLVEGSYPALVSFLSALESAGTKLTVESVQVTSSDGATDKVTATIVVAAFRSIGSTDGNN